MIPESQNKREMRWKSLEKRILIVSDKKEFYENICEYIKFPYLGDYSEHGDAAGSFRRSPSKALKNHSLVIIDNDTGDGLETLKMVRKRKRSVPVIYASFVPDSKWIQENFGERSNVSIHYTIDLASPKIKSILDGYFPKENKKK
jgi:hypothetical protein